VFLLSIVIYVFGVLCYAAHSSLDDHLARWFGLNQSKYQWALDDYYESKGLVSISSECGLL
jgi:hypothetical protein